MYINGGYVLHIFWSALMSTLILHHIWVQTSGLNTWLFQPFQFFSLCSPFWHCVASPAPTYPPAPLIAHMHCSPIKVDVNIIGIICKYCRLRHTFTYFCAFVQRLGTFNCCNLCCQKQWSCFVSGTLPISRILWKWGECMCLTQKFF